MDTKDKLAELFRAFPGIGTRQARRFVYFLLTRDNAFLKELVSLLGNLKKEMSQCSFCYRYFPGQNAKVCIVCSERANSPMLMVLEKDVDFENIKGTLYTGLFFVLGGVVPLVEENPGKHIRIHELIKRVEKDKNIKEIILALSVNAEGENTIQYIKKTLEPLASARGIKISTLGRGLSTGSELEYSDSDTLSYALKNRS